MKIVAVGLLIGFCIGCSGTAGPVIATGGTIGVGGMTATGGATITSTNQGGATAPGTGGSPASSGGSSGVMRACTGASTSPSPQACHSVSDCKLLSPVKCCTSSDCWGAAACPLPPTACTSIADRFQCTVDADCSGGGTCVSNVQGCPQCEYRHCEYPPPACTQNPDSCAPGGSCQSDGSCAPLLCTEGFSCPSGSRCSIGSGRADTHGCELTPCDEGWSCPENTRCTAPTDSGSHGCTFVSCTSDQECDCGYCVNGSCAANLGWCSQAPA